MLVAAITYKEFNNDVISYPPKPTNNRNQAPKYIKQLEASITNTGRKFAQLEAVINLNKRKSLLNIKEIYSTSSARNLVIQEQAL